MLLSRLKYIYEDGMMVFWRDKSETRSIEEPYSSE